MVAEEDAFELNSYWSKLGLGLGQDMSSSSSTLIFYGQLEHVQDQWYPLPKK